MPKKDPDLENITFSGKLTAEFFDVSSRTLTEWVKDGFPRIGTGKYPLKACFDWWVQKRAGGEQSNDINEEKLKRERAKRIQDELKAEQMKGTLVPADAAKSWLRTLLSEARLALDGLPRRLASVLATITDEKEIEHLLRTEIRAILERLARPVKGRKEKK